MVEITLKEYNDFLKQVDNLQMFGLNTTDKYDDKRKKELQFLKGK